MIPIITQICKKISDVFIGIGDRTMHLNTQIAENANIAAKFTLQYRTFDEHFKIC
jgi:hypothetical protein